MNLFEYTKGRVVRSKFSENYYGHIVGFDEVHYDRGAETTLKVLWQDGEVRNIHPANVVLS